MKPATAVLASAAGRCALLCLGLAALLLPVPSCQKVDSGDDHAVIDQGVQGKILFWQGNFMCCPVTGTKKPAARTVFFHELTNLKQAVQIGYSSFFTDIRTRVVATTNSNRMGLYQVRLEPGRYSVFVKEGQRFYANGIDDDGNIQPVQVVAGSVCILDIDITYAAWF